MQRDGFMMRLIDIVFILLFGFISISEIGLQHPIEPPKSTEQRSQDTKDKQTLFIGITKQGTFIVETPLKEVFRYSDIHQIKKLLEMIHSQSKTGAGHIRVHICSNWDAPIKYAMDVADLCDTYKLSKSLVVRKVEKPV